jgi:Zn-dependent peptidase ImmA (M78 family)
MKTEAMTLRALFARLPADGKVRHILRSFNMSPKSNGKVASVKTLAEALGFVVERVKMLPKQHGRLVPDAFAENGFRIEVNERDDVLRQRWTVVHEIVHYFLHVDRSDPFAPSKLRDLGDHLYDQRELLEEREANLLTEAVFFGDGALAAAVSLYGRDEQVLSRYFGVSTSAISIAIQKL